MAEGCGSWFPLQQFDWLSPKLNTLAASHPLGQQSINPPFVNSGTSMVSATGTLPVYGYHDLPHLQVGQVNESHGRCYYLPPSQQVFAPASNTFLKERLPPDPYGNRTENIVPKAGSGCSQKRFLVFDQSGGQTTMMLSSFGTPIKCGSLGPKFPFACNLSREDPLAKVSLNLHPGLTSKGVFDDNGTDVQSEMREDTEELNALLYSDGDGDSDYTEDEEVASTGHSPSTMTAHYEQSEEGAEGVASYTGLTKRRKLLDGSNGCMQFPVNNTSSVNHSICSELEDDADSSFTNGQNPVSDDMDSSSGNKRMWVDKIRETVSVLRSLIPGVGGKDAVMVLDEAIDCLHSLKRKAETLGLGTL
ncbi:transcription factor bHLH145-like [Hibiscus syriacus]|nr:transcription factor bHLH145-like [Hibiscus syriacus]